MSSSLEVRCFDTQSRQSAKFFSSRRNWDSPNPSPAGECPNSDERTYTVVLYIYNVLVCTVLCALTKRALALFTIRQRLCRGTPPPLLPCVHQPWGQTNTVSIALPQLQLLYAKPLGCLLISSGAVAHLLAHLSRKM
jgi:hypothetical protein